MVPLRIERKPHQSFCLKDKPIGQRSTSLFHSNKDLKLKTIDTKQEKTVLIKPENYVTKLKNRFIIKNTKGFRT
jgi:hypothetical protein